MPAFAADEGGLEGISSVEAEPCSTSFRDGTGVTRYDGAWKL